MSQRESHANGTIGCDVLVVGGINMDYIARGLSLPVAGESCEGDLFVVRPGGKGANQAVVAARLGVAVAMIGAVGNDDRGRVLVAHLHGEGVDVRHVRTLEGQATGIAVVQVDGRGRKQSLAVSGANAALDPQDVIDACTAIGHARVVLAQCEIPLACLTAAFEWGRRVGARTILDPAPPRLLPDALVGKVDVIKPNAREAEALTGIAVSNHRTAREAAHVLLLRGAGAALVEAGEDGTLVLQDRRELLLPRLPVASVDTTGGGDALGGAFAAYTAKGADLFDAARIANTAAGLEVTAVGAQTPRITEDLLRRHGVLP
jgi:ribokinase